MELSHTFTVPASLDQTWATFMDLQEVGSCFPGATVTEVTDTGFSGTVKVKLGPIALVYSGTGSFIERDDTAHRAVIEAKGKDKRGNGTAGATVAIQLSDAGDGKTMAEVQTDLNVTGKPAQFGRGVMQDVSDKLLGQFVACIEDKVGAPAVPEPETAPAGVPGSAATVAPGSGSPAPVPAAPAAARTPTPSREPEALDLGTAVLPVVLRSYAKQIAAGLVALLAAVALVLRRRRKG
ncbi:MAG: SRPBCC family protein [Pedococcus sp.]